MIKLFLIVLAAVLINCSKPSVNDLYKLPADYQKWKRSVKQVLSYLISGHGNKAHVIYANEKAYQLEVDSKSDPVKYIGSGWRNCCKRDL